LGLSEQILQSLTAMGFEEPTPVQAQAIPLLLAGRDVIAQALTGTGKTAAYGVPIAERVDPQRPVPQSIVMTPTRELAIQVTDHLCKISRHRHLSVVPIYGGQPIGRQLATLRRGAQVIVATPGRLLDHLRRGSLSLDEVRLLVLDEADQMLEMGFIEDVQYVLDRLPEERVSALFSATMPKPIVDLAQRYLRDPEMLRLSRPQSLTVPAIDQSFYIVPFARKLDALCRVLDTRQPDRAIVFCATKRTVDDVVEGLGARGYQAEALHGDISQVMRERVLRSFRAGQTEVLVATDVAARGLDVPEVSHVINFDIPPDPEYYVHRIGRTGRSGRSGVAITFVNPREMRALRIIERVTGAHIRREEVPTAAEVEEREAEMLEARLLATLSKGNWGRYRPIVEELFEAHDPIDVAAAALSLAASGTNLRRQSSVAAAVRTVRPPEREPVTQQERPAERERPTDWERPAGRERPADRERPAERERERRPAAGAPAVRRPAAVAPTVRRTAGRATREDTPPDRRPRRDAPDGRERGPGQPDDRRRAAPAPNDRRRFNDAPSDRRPVRPDLRALADEADEILRGERQFADRGPAPDATGESRPRRRPGQPTEQRRPEKPRRQFLSFGKPGARRPKQGPRPSGKGRRG
jgi:ATP-dependent RNA helicase DeaD